MILNQAALKRQATVHTVLQGTGLSLQVDRLQRLEQASRRVLDEIEHALESRCAAVIRIGHFLDICLREVKE